MRAVILDRCLKPLRRTKRRPCVSGNRVYYAAGSPLKHRNEQRFVTKEVPAPKIKTSLDDGSLIRWCCYLAISAIELVDHCSQLNNFDRTVSPVVFPAYDQITTSGIMPVFTEIGTAILEFDQDTLPTIAF